MKRILVILLAALMFLGVFAVGAGAVGYDDLTAEQKAQFDKIYTDSTSIYWQFKLYTSCATVAADTSLFNEKAMIDETKMDEYLGKIREAEDEVKATAAYREYDAFCDDEEALVAAFLAGTLKADLEAKLDAYWEEIYIRYRPLNSAYLKPEFIAFTEAVETVYELEMILMFFSGLSQEKIMEIKRQAEALVAEYGFSINQIVEQGNWAEGKATLDDMNAKMRALLVREGVIPPESYTVTYNANGGTNTPEAQTKTEGVTLVLRTAVPTRDGHTFKGWATSATGAVVYAPGANYTANAAATLYAVWEANAAVSVPRYFWSDWPPFLQSILRYVLFGWLWMGWVKPL